LLRPVAGRWLAGVCAGLAVYLRVPVKWVRVAVVALTLLGGAGIFAYLFWWLTVPTGDPARAEVISRPTAIQRLARRQTDSPDPMALLKGIWRREVITGLVLLGTAVGLVAVRLGWDWRHSWVPPAVMAAAGLALAWSQLEDTETGQASRSLRMWLRVGGGTILVVAGILVFFWSGRPFWEFVQTGLAILVVLLGAGLVIAPWWVRLGRRLGDASAAQAREAERADIAAHLHDSVLQTLALIRANATDADTVARLARSQERELRTWLYDDRPEESTSLAAQIKEVAAQVEDGKVGKVGAPVAPIDVVVVGDCSPDEATAALLAATKEALVNAVAHGAPPISVYVEVTEPTVEVFVRDRGEGFDMEAVPRDRLGVRESIFGRMERKGGSAEIVSRPGWGTEVRLKSPRKPED
jgi:phage shock protein PspC (stress-responsive transcriptional regulator)/two-component sensor histidine kinase